LPITVTRRYSPLRPNSSVLLTKKPAARLSRLVSGGVLLTSLFTRYELGLVKVVPFKAHLAADVAVGLATLGAPFLFGFSRNKKARNFFVGLGAFSIMAGLLTEPKEMDEEDRDDV
jgi:hypothetical protein